MEIPYCYYRIFFMKVITVKCCARHDNCTVVSSFVAIRYPIMALHENKKNPSNLNHDGKSSVKCVPGSTLVQAMACFQTAPSNYLNNCWLLSGGDLGIHQGHGWPQCTLFKKYVFGNTDLEFLFFSKILLQSCWKIEIYYLLLNTKKTTQNQAWDATFNP